jgi:hypothetical protein
LSLARLLPPNATRPSPSTASKPWWEDPGPSGPVWLAASSIAGPWAPFDPNGLPGTVVVAPPGTVVLVVDVTGNVVLVVVVAGNVVLAIVLVVVVVVVVEQGHCHPPWREATTRSP